MATTTPVLIGMKALTEGFMGAYDRLHAALRDYRDPEAVFRPLFEALNWWVAIADRVERDGREWDPRAAGPLVGIRYVRGRVHHQWSEAFELRDDFCYEPICLGLDMTVGKLVYFDPIPNPVTEWRWRDSSELPSADHPRFEQGKPEYEQHLAAG